MASQYLEVDPEFALEHALAAVRRGGRVAAVREAAAIAAYVAEHYDVALRELRTHRRMSGSSEHLALIVDSERALGRIEKALETAAEPTASNLEPAEKVEVALVVSGIHRDRGDLTSARRALEIPELDRKRAFAYSPRLFQAYSDILEEQGQSQDARSWARMAVIAEAALGQGQFEEPEIYEIDVFPDDEPEGLPLTDPEEEPMSTEEFQPDEEQTIVDGFEPEELATEEIRAELGDVADKSLLEEENPGSPDATDEAEIEGDVVTEDVADEGFGSDLDGDPEELEGDIVPEDGEGELYPADMTGEDPETEPVQEIDEETEQYLEALDVEEEDEDTTA
ncbi:hypothetical protein NBM05_04380 [Rothia sp. AR01]|uniref:TPR-repeat-containing protein n=1 Tax=Rothia santali TaxID=2949643 RepID=A0A9X2HBP4_9MICC|nr:hypothetical protein [Rothia santali]MCP3425280.1 hypothetical protein [Rothia santali]